MQLQAAACDCSSSSAEEISPTLDGEKHVLVHTGFPIPLCVEGCSCQKTVMYKGEEYPILFPPEMDPRCQIQIPVSRYSGGGGSYWCLDHLVTNWAIRGAVVLHPLQPERILSMCMWEVVVGGPVILGPGSVVYVATRSEDPEAVGWNGNLSSENAPDVDLYDEEARATFRLPFEHLAALCKSRGITCKVLPDTEPVEEDDTCNMWLSHERLVESLLRENGVFPLRMKGHYTPYTPAFTPSGKRVDPSFLGPFLAKYPHISVGDDFRYVSGLACLLRATQKLRNAAEHGDYELGKIIPELQSSKNAFSWRFANQMITLAQKYFGSCKTLAPDVKTLVLSRFPALPASGASEGSPKDTMRIILQTALGLSPEAIEDLLPFWKSELSEENFHILMQALEIYKQNLSGTITAMEGKERLATLLSPLGPLESLYETEEVREIIEHPEWGPSLEDWTPLLELLPGDLPTSEGTSASAAAATA